MSKTIADIASSEDRDNVEKNLIYAFTHDSMGKPVPLAKLINFTLPDDSQRTHTRPTKATEATHTQEQVDTKAGQETTAHTDTRDNRQREETKGIE